MLEEPSVQQADDPQLFVEVILTYRKIAVKRGRMTVIIIVIKKHWKLHEKKKANGKPIGRRVTCYLLLLPTLKGRHQKSCNT